MLKDIMNSTFWDNIVLQYIVSAAVLAAGVLLVAAVRGVVLKRLRERADRTESIFDYMLHMVMATAFLALYLGIAYFPVHYLAPGDSAKRAVEAAGVVVLTVLGIRLGIKTLSLWVERYWMKKAGEAASTRTLLRLLPVIKFFLWVLGVIFILDNLGFKVSTVIAGLGIGGIAVALAAQAVLGDLFSYFAILFDKPFEEGDFIIEGEYMGTIEHIGIKTTRIRSLSGEQLVFSNSDLTTARIRNYKRMQRRRVVFRLGVVYQTKQEELKAIPGVIKGIIGSLENTEFDRAHFLSFGDFSLLFEVVYYVLSSDYNVYMDIQQDINFRIREEFENSGIEFAYPTQTLYVGGSETGPSTES